MEKEPRKIGKEDLAFTLSQKIQKGKKSYCVHLHAQ